MRERRPARWVSAVYVLMVVATILAFLVVRHYGETLEAPRSAGTPAAESTSGSSDHVFLQVLTALAAVVIAGQILARIVARFGQPPVIGEVIAGILLGPSFLGERASAMILPPDVAPFLQVIAQLGVVLYMFIVGLELNVGLIRRRVHAIVATSSASILLPFLLGSALALFLYPRVSSQDVPFTSFALFLGIAMSITAFPVLARILTDRGMHRTELGSIALSCAAANDVTAWCLLAFVVGIVRAEIESSVAVFGWTLLFIAGMVLAVRPLMVRATARWEQIGVSRPSAAIVLIGLLLSAVAAETIGIHAIFGAFLFGAVIPHDGVVARQFTRQLEHIVTVLLLPAFFAYIGMRTRIDLLGDAASWLICGLIILVATLGKFGGTLAAARLTGLSWRDAAVLGALMNTRGLMELIVLNIGLDLHVISPTVFSMMVLMALVTTMAAAPAMHWLSPPPHPAPRD